MLSWLALAYVLSLAATMMFFAGASVLNEHWDRESARTLRLMSLFHEAA